jgi:hypothetical protein
MNKSLISIILLFLVIKISAQNTFITKLKDQGRDSIIQYSLSKLKEKKITIAPVISNKIRVMANSKEVFVLINMGFYWDINENCLKNYDLCVTYNETGYIISPLYYELNIDDYKLSKAQIKIIHFVMNNQPCPFAYDERIKITEEKDYYEMTCSRGYESGAECYHIDKKTGERSMIWHETPYPGDDMKLVKPEDEFKEIK